MTRSVRIRLLIVVVVLGIPLIAAAIILGWVGGGGLSHKVERQYAHDYPGSLSIGGIQLDGMHRAIAEDISLRPPGGGAAVIAVARAEVGYELVPPHATSVALHGLHLAIGRGAVELARAFAVKPGKRGGDVHPLDLAIDGGGDIAGIPLEDLAVALSTGPAGTEGTVNAMLAGRPLRLTLAKASGRDPAKPAVRIRVDACAIALEPLFSGLIAMGLITEQDDLLPWLPAVASLAGSTFVFDPAAGTLAGDAVVTWEGGSGGAMIKIDRAGLRLDQAHADDAGLGSGQGELIADFATKAMQVRMDHWVPGPRLAVVPKLPLAELIELLPRVDLRLTHPGPKLDIAFLPPVGAATENPAEARLAWSKHAPIEVLAFNLPLPLAQPYAPDGVLLSGGRIARFDAKVDAGRLQRMGVQAVGAEIAVQRWTARDLDLGVTVLPADAADPAKGYETRVSLPFADLVHRGTGEAAEVTLIIARLDEALVRLSGPSPLPALSGLLKIVAVIDKPDAASWSGRILHIAAGSISQPGVLRDIVAAGTGSFTWGGQALELRLAGHLPSGELALPNGWLDLARRTPAFTATAAIDAKGLHLVEALARAADRFGQPDKQGFTAELSGAIGTDFSGRIEGVVDRGDLAWFTSNTSLVPLPKGSELTGEGAATFAIDIIQGRIDRLGGWILPLNVDVQLLDGDLDIRGIKGAIRFLLEKAKPGDRPTTQSGEPAKAK